MARDTERYRDVAVSAADRDDLETIGLILRQVAKGATVYHGTYTCRALADTLDHLGRNWDEAAVGEYVRPAPLREAS